jgi:hypothetical protein
LVRGHISAFAKMLHRAAIAASSVIFLLRCECVPVSDRLWLGPKPSPLTSPDGIAIKLRSEANPSINGFQRDIGFLTTPFKRIGILGWRDTGFSMTVSGTVVHSPVYSSDGFLTIDLRLSKIVIGGKDIPLVGERFIRAEVCVCSPGLQRNQFPITNDRLAVTGRVLWDGDGFYEIHPACGSSLDSGP